MIRTYSDNDNYKLVIEMEEDHLFLHIDVFNWNKSILKAIRLDMIRILYKSWQQGWKEIYAYTPNPKFANMIAPCEIIGLMEGRDDLTIVKWDTG